MKKMCFYDISIHSNFNQNQSINACVRMILSFDAANKLKKKKK